MSADIEVIVESGQVGIVIDPRNKIQTIVDGIQGPSGKDGGSTFVLTASATLSGHRVVRARASDGLAVYADNATLADAGMVIGITTGAAAMGAPATIQPFGVLSDVSFSFTPGELVFVGMNGLLTQTPPMSPAVFSQVFGIAMNVTTIFISIESAIIL